MADLLIAVSTKFIYVWNKIVDFEIYIPEEYPPS
jgi:hypothetical protein